MRSLLVMGMFVASLAAAAAHDYREQRELELAAAGIDAVEIEAGAGNLDVTGVPGLDEIGVTATIEVPDRDADAARDIVESALILTLEKRGSRAVLTARFDDTGWHSGDNPRVHLDVRMPDRLDLVVDDGSGSIVVSSLNADVEIEDGSGSLDVSNIGGTLDIDDGSGSIMATTVGGDLSIEDGSGSITVRQVGGSVIIDDGSGGIDVTDVTGDLIIVNDGSGGLDYADIRGRVQEE